MKNDFREFYDEDYILHTAVEGSEDEYISHSLRSTIHKYIDKFKNRLGKWVYVYPEDKKENMAVTYEREQRKARSIGNQGPSITYEREQRKARRIGNERAQKVAKFRSTPMKKMSRLDRLADDKLWSKQRGQSDYSIVMNNQERLAKRAAKEKDKAIRSAVRSNEKANIYKSYANSQKKAAASARSAAQKKSQYEHYADLQRREADKRTAAREQSVRNAYELKKHRAAEKKAIYQDHYNPNKKKKYRKYGTKFHTYAPGRPYNY